ncbi:MAG: M67 family metallopeptidase [Cyanobacteriota bacterium]|nr:M67 family metallopeptidase [Cyanobacteriota bacterium]
MHDSPDEILFGWKVLTVARAVVRAAAPEEGCALLLGPRWTVRRLWPCRNVWNPPEERTRRFSIDPREQLLAQKWARRWGWQVLGALHSHPGGEPVPSATDRELAVPPALMVIQGASELACWWLPEEGEPSALMWKMETSLPPRVGPHASSRYHWRSAEP